MGNALKKLHRDKKDRGQSEHQTSAPTTTVTTTNTYGRVPPETATSTGQNRTRGPDPNASNSAAGPTTSRGIDAAPEGPITTRGQT